MRFSVLEVLTAVLALATLVTAGIGLWNVFHVSRILRLVLASYLSVTDLDVCYTPALSRKSARLSFRVADVVGIRTVLRRVTTQVHDLHALAVSGPVGKETVQLSVPIELLRAFKTPTFKVVFPVIPDGHAMGEEVASIMVRIVYDDALSGRQQTDSFGVSCTYAGDGQFTAALQGSGGIFGTAYGYEYLHEHRPPTPPARRGTTWRPIEL